MAGYAVALGVAALIFWAAMAGVTPVFFVQGQGGTLIRQAVNERYCQITSYSRDDLLGQPARELSPGGDRDGGSRRLASYLAREKPVYESEEKYLCKDGKEIWVQVTVSVIRDAKGEPVRLAGVVQDISARKLAEEELKATNAELTSFNNAMVGRELRMIELKKEVDELRARFGQPLRYGYAPEGQ